MARITQPTKPPSHFYFSQRKLFTVIRSRKVAQTYFCALQADLMARKPAMVVAVALANKNARIAWALLRHGGTYRRTATATA